VSDPPKSSTSAKSGSAFLVERAISFPPKTEKISISTRWVFKEFYGIFCGFVGISCDRYPQERVGRSLIRKLLDKPDKNSKKLLQMPQGGHRYSLNFLKNSQVHLRHLL
jgi:hypothetical protein